MSVNNTLYLEGKTVSTEAGAVKGASTPAVEFTNTIEQLIGNIGNEIVDTHKAFLDALSKTVRDKEQELRAEDVYWNMLADEAEKEIQTPEVTALLRERRRNANP